MKKRIIILIIILVVLGIGFVLLRGEEDTWICVNGEWVKHGVPSAPKPTEPCGDKFICVIDEDCAVFGEDGDCDCGCFNKNHNWEKEGDCFCMAPKSCKCISGVCENVFEDKSDLIKVNTPQPNQKIKNPINIEGEARGNWFFEATFPIKLLDKEGNQLAGHYVTAKGEWMTENFVSFEGLLEFNIEEETDTILVLEKDNPSGLPENDDELLIPIRLIPSETSNIEGWKVYTDQDKGLSINYPPEMTLMKEAGGIKFLFLGPTQRTGTELYDGIIFYVFKESYNQNTLKEFVEVQLEEEKKFEVTVTKELENWSFSGFNGYSYEIQGLGVFTYIFIDAGPGKTIKITYLAPDPKNQGFQQTVNTMISTLKFID